MSNQQMLAVVQRELQVSARKKATFLFRFIAAAFGLLVALLYLALSEQSPELGGQLFWTVTVASCAFAVWEGARRATVSICEERAQGTLGLLFLTPLKFREVIAGKFAGAAALAFQCVLALTPVMAISMILGGVSAGELARATIWVANATFFFVAACLFISAITASEMAAIFLVVLLVGIVLTAFGMEARNAAWSFPLGNASLVRFDPISPAHFLRDARYGMHRESFWLSIAASHLLGWALLGACRFFLQHTWTRQEVFPALAILWTRKPKVRKWKGPIRILGNLSPLEWLTLRNKFPQSAFWFTCALIGLSVILYASMNDNGDAEALGLGIATFNAFVLAITIMIHSSEALARAKKEGLLELVSVTSMSDREIVDGQIRAIIRMFAAPCAITILWGLFLLPWREILPEFYGDFSEDWLWSFLPVYYFATVGLTFWAGAYTGIWAALQCKTPGRAVLRTILLALIFPWVLPVPAGLYLFILGHVARYSVRTEFRSILQKRMPRPPEFPTIAREEIVSQRGKRVVALQS